MKLAILFCAAALQMAAAGFEYRVLATTLTSTMEKEMNEAAAAGFVFADVMGGETAFGGHEVVVIMTKAPSAAPEKRTYRLVATARTSTMQKKLQQLGQDGFAYRGQTVFRAAMEGAEVAVILERNPSEAKPVEYLLLATSRTSTMQKELNEAGAAGFRILGMTVGKTAFGGDEVVCVLRRD